MKLKDEYVHSSINESQGTGPGELEEEAGNRSHSLAREIHVLVRDNSEGWLCQITGLREAT